MSSIPHNLIKGFTKFIIIGIIAACFVLYSCVNGYKSSTRSQRKQKPNIILIMVDDMGFSDIGSYGAEIINTPNIDRLAEKGLRFTHFYNAARCCPTRASLLTGLYPHQVGMGDMISMEEENRPSGPYQGYLNERCVTIAEVLKQAGYHTIMSGKWHVGEFRPHWPTDRGFDRYFGLISGAANYFDISKGKREGIVRKMSLNGKLYTPPEEDFYMTDAITKYAIEFLNTYEPKDEPFFLYVAYTAPHWPLHALPEDIDKYRGKFMVGWNELRKLRYENLIKLGIIDKERCTLSPLDEQVTPWEHLEEDVKQEMVLKMAVYAAQIDRMDQGIGKILERVKKLGKEENTLVMFLSDNGGCHVDGPWGFDRRNNGLPPGGEDSYMSYGRSWANASNTPFRLFKHWVHEGGIATPFIAYWPGVINSGITDQVAHVIDIMATCADIAGVEYPENYKENKIIPLEGKSLLPIFRGEHREGHDYIFWEHEGNRAILNGEWKLVSISSSEWELYNLKSDRSETNNLADKYPEIMEDLKAKYRQWASRCGVKEKEAEK